MYSNDLRLHCAGTGTATVTVNMRMCIRLARLTVDCPTGMANTTGSFQGLAAICFLDQFGQVPPFAFTTRVSDSPSRTGSPAELYPLYSSLDRPSNRIGATCRFPVNPTIPHIGFAPPIIHFSMILFHLHKTTPDTARVVIDFIHYIPFRRSH